MKLLFKYATRSRPELFKRGIRSIIDNCVSDNYTILVSIDRDDPTMSLEDIKYKNTIAVEGESKNKIDAINRDIHLVENWDVIINMSDDMVFTKKGFDDIIRESCRFGQIGAFNDFVDIHWTTKCLHFPDGNRNDLITMAILGREVYDKFDYIYHPSYKSLWCDNEMTDVAKKDGSYRFIDEQIFEHLHPAYGKGHFDKQYQITESFNDEDRANYYKRKENNFGL